MLDHLVEVVRAEKVDVVVVAGDVYDRALPGVDVVALLDDALARLAGTGAVVVLTSGNHDSPRRLGFAARLLERSRVHVRTDPGALRRPGAPRGPARAGRDLSPPLSRAGPRRDGARAGSRGRPRGGPHRRGGRRPHGPGRPRAGDPLRARGPRLRRGRPEQRQRARHQRRRDRRRAGRPLRRRRLRGPGPPARPPATRGRRAVLRLAARVLVLRARAREGLLAGGARSRGPGTGGRRRRAGPPPAGRPARATRGAARRPGARERRRPPGVR